MSLIALWAIRNSSKIKRVRTRNADLPKQPDSMTRSRACEEANYVPPSRVVTAFEKTWKT